MDPILSDTPHTPQSSFLSAIPPSSGLYPACLQGGGEAGKLLRSIRWADTPLGEPAQWPVELITTLAMLLHATVPMCLFWGEQRLCFVNDPCLTQATLPGPDVIGKPLVQVWPDAQAFVQDWIAPLFAMRPTEASAPKKASLPAENQVVFGYSPVWTVAGEVAGVLGIATDRRPETSLLTQEDLRLQLLFEFAPVAISMYKGEDFIIDFANIQMLHIWDRDLEEVLHKPLLEALPEVRGQGYDAILTQVRTSGESFRSTEIAADLVRNGQKETRYFNLVFQPYWEGKEEAAGVIAIAYEVTEQVRARRQAEASEERFRTLVADATVATAVYRGREMQIELANESMIRLWGKDASVIGKTIRQALPELDEQPFHALLERVYTTGETYHATEDRADLLREGKLQTFYFNFTYKALRDANGEIYGILNMAVDVTAQVLTRKQIEESQERLTIALDSAQMGTWEYRPQTNVLIFSDRTRDLFGFLPGQPVSLDDALQAIVEEDRDRVKASIGKALDPASGGTYDEEYSLINSQNHQSYTIRVKGKAFFDESGVATRFTGTALDCTEQKRSEATLRYRKALLEAQNEAIPDAILIVDTKGKILSYNRHFAELWRMPASIVASHDDAAALEHAITQVVDPQGFIERVNYLYTHPEAIAHEEILFKDGRIIERYGNGVVGEDGTSYGWAWYFRDITIRRKAEREIQLSLERFRLLADFMPQFVWTSEPDGTLTYFNQAMYAYSGLTPLQMTDNGWLQMVHPDERDATARRWMLSVQTGANFIFEHRFRFRNGEYRWQLSRALPQRDPEGTVQMWIGTSTDIHDQKSFVEALEQKVLERTRELQAANKNLAQSNAELEQFAYVASHDLHEPLRKVKAFGGLLRREITPYQNENPRLETYLERMESAVERMQQLMTDLLAFSRIGRVAETFVWVDLNTVLKKILLDLDVKIQETGACLFVSDLPAIVGSALQMEQLFLNLLSNALKFLSTDRVPEIRIQSEPVTTEEIQQLSLNPQKTYTRIMVRDNGIGFEEEYKEKIFIIFQRLHGRQEYIGTGIGLAICKRVAENHGGRIFADSQPGQGAVFTVILPVAEPDFVS